jgi:histidine phosphotransferase ChpT
MSDKVVSNEAAVAPLDLPALDVAALIASRVCHDVINPVGAIINGLDAVDEEKDPAGKEETLKLVRSFAERASGKLQFARIAFGAAGSAGSAIDLGDARKVTEAIFEGERTSLAWNLPRLILPKNRVKLLLNLILIASGTIPRGGVIDITPIGEGENIGFLLTMTGMNSRIPANIPPLLAGQPDEHGVNAHGFQPFFTGMLARAAQMPVTITQDGDTVTIRAEPPAA